MNAPHKADPAIYLKLREGALQRRLPLSGDDAAHAVLMDWNISNGTVTVLAAANGEASMYLSSGGGFIGGSQRYPSVREAALRSMQVALHLRGFFRATESIGLPAQGDIFFYLTTGKDVRIAVATEGTLRAGTDRLLPLWDAMQKIVTEYRMTQTKAPAPPGAVQ